MAEFLLLRREELRQTGQRPGGVGGAGGVVGRVDEHGVHIFGQHLLERVKVDLEVGKAGRDDAQLRAGQVHIRVVFREERREGENLVARGGDQTERVRQRAGRAAGHEDVLALVVHAEAAVQRRGDLLAHCRDAQTRAVAVHEHRVAGLDQLDQPVVVGLGHGDARVAQAVVKHVLVADFLAARGGVLAQLADDGFAGEHALVLLGDHGAFLLLFGKSFCKASCSGAEQQDLQCFVGDAAGSMPVTWRARGPDRWPPARPV